MRRLKNERKKSEVGDWQTEKQQGQNEQES